MPICLNSPGTSDRCWPTKHKEKPDKSPFVLLYAFNGTGKTRLSAAFKDLGKVEDENDEVQSRDTLYFNAFTEDLFSWDNDLENDEHRTLKLNPAASFFVGLNELEIENRIRPLLDRYADFDFRINFAFDETDWQHHQRRGDLLPQGTERRGGRRADRRGGRHQDFARRGEHLHLVLLPCDPPTRARRGRGV